MLIYAFFLIHYIIFYAPTTAMFTLNFWTISIGAIWMLFYISYNSKE